MAQNISGKHKTNRQEGFLASFVSRLGGLFAAPAMTGHAASAKPDTPPRSVQKAARKGNRRGAKARKAVAEAKGGARKPPARKIAHKAGAGMAKAAKADTKSRAKAASRARQATETGRSKRGK